MPNLRQSSSIGLLVTTGFLLAAGIAAPAAGLESLQGNWVTHKTNEMGQPYSQHLNFSDNKVRFEIKDNSLQSVLVAKGNVKAERQGPFQVLLISDIIAGRTEADLEPVDRDSASVYSLEDGILYVASNFDRARDNQPPRVEVYKRPQASASDAAATPAGPDLSGTWKLVLMLNDQELEYELKLRRDGQKYKGTLVSPRSGDHEMKSVDFTNGQLRMVIDRKINDTDATFIYDGKLEAASKLAGQLQIEAGGNEITGSWKATK